MDINELEEFLMSDATGDEAMLLPDLDGFLTGIAVGPEMIMPSEWLPKILGRESRFASEQQAQSVYGAIMEWYNGILHTLQNAPEEYEPFLYDNHKGDPVFSDWAWGFLAAMDLRPAAWDPMFNSEDNKHYLYPITAHLPDETGGGFIIGEDAYEELYALMTGNEAMLADCVVGIARFWKQARGYYHGKTKLGRNDLCFCGSGKKFKKCCGSN